jgi:hypothetical protein
MTINVSDFDFVVMCEESGMVRDALRRKGINAISCDIKPTSWPGPHYQGDARDIIHLPWKGMIAHPDCTFLANSGSKHLYKRVNGKNRKENGIDPERMEEVKKGAEHFLMFEKAEHIPLICVENPIQHFYAVEIIGRRADQYVHPHWFGNPYQKATGLHLTRFPRLKRKFWEWEYEQIYQEVWMMGPSEDRKEKRSKTDGAIAEAMAEQWEEIIKASIAGKL